MKKLVARLLFGLVMVNTLLIVGVAHGEDAIFYLCVNTQTRSITQFTSTIPQCARGEKLTVLKKPPKDEEQMLLRNATECNSPKICTGVGGGYSSRRGQ